MRTLLLSLVLPLGGAGALHAQVNCPGGSGTCHEIRFANVSDTRGGPWLSGHTYLVVGWATVPANETLTIQPGAVVKFDGQSSRFDVSGTLLAGGSSGSPVIFTSYRDDSAGGDHNGDGGATTPARGNWSRINFYGGSEASRMSWCELRYAGYFGAPALDIYTTGILLEDTKVRDCGGDGAHLRYAPTAVRRCDFDRCRRPLSRVSPSFVHLLSANRASGNTEGDFVFLDTGTNDYFALGGTRSWNASQSLNGNGVLVVSNSLRIVPGATLTLGAGVAIRWLYNGGVDVQGTLIANGTAAAPVVITANGDALYGGDGTAAPGDWDTLALSGGGTGTLAYTHLRYGGGTVAALRVFQGNLTMSHCRIERSGSAGLQPGSTPPVIDGCAFDHNATDAVASVPLAFLAGFTNNTASGNGNGDAMVIGGGTLATAATLGPANAFNGSGTFLLRSTLFVGTAGRLGILPGVVVKADPANSPYIRVDGVLDCDATSGAQVVFTSIFDDQHGENLNPAGASPAAGDWRGLVLTDPSDPSVLSNVLVRYAGAGGNPAIALSGSDCSLASLTIERCAGPGISCLSSAPTIAGCTISECTRPIVDLALEHLRKLTNVGGSNNGEGDAFRFDRGQLRTSLTLDRTSTFNQSGVLVFEDQVRIEGGAVLTLERGMVLKFDGNVGLTAVGELVCNGVASEEVVFTSVHDDAHGGNSTGTPSTGTPGDWSGLATSFTVQATTLRHTRIRFAGQAGRPGLELDSGTLAMDQVVVEKCLAAGMETTGNPNATVTNLRIDECEVPIRRGTIAMLTGFSNVTASGNAQGDHLRVNRPGFFAAVPAAILKTMTPNASGVILVEGDLVFSQEFRLGPGLILKFAPGRRIALNSAVLVDGGAGANRVVFTSIHDAEHGGPTSSSSPTAGDWIGIEFNSDQSVVNNLLVRYAGFGGAPAIELFDADVFFCDLCVERCLGVAIDANGTSSPVLKNPKFVDVGTDPLAGITWATLGNMIGPQFLGSLGTSATYIDSPVVAGDLRIDKENYFGGCIVVTTTPLTSPGNTLSFGPGVVLKIASPGVEMRVLDVLGSGAEKVVFTSLHDDEHGGDTEGDGNASVPLPGDWGGVEVDLAGRFEHALVRYGKSEFFGGPTGDSGVVRSPLADFRASRAEHCLGSGFKTGGNAYDLVAYENSGRGIYAELAENCTAVRNTDAGIVARRAAYCISWNNTIGNYQAHTFNLGAPLLDTFYCVGISQGIDARSPVTNSCGPIGWGNSNAGPRFVDEANGDLRLSASSPYRNFVRQPIPRSILNDPGLCSPPVDALGFPWRTPSSRDHLEYPRAIDDDGTGPAPMLPDLGAYERYRHTLVTSGDTRLGGSSFSVSVQGPAGLAAFYYGNDGLDFFVPGLGFLLVDVFTVRQAGVLAIGTSLAIPLPRDPLLHDLVQNLQGLVVDSAGSVGFTNLYRARLHL